MTNLPSLIRSGSSILSSMQPTDNSRTGIGARVARAAGIVAGSIAAYEAARDIFSEVKEHFTYSVEVEESRNLHVFEAVMNELALLTRDNMRHGTFVDKSRGNGSFHTRTKASEYAMWMTRNTSRAVTLQGHRVWFQISDVAPTRSRGASERRGVVTFFTMTRAGHKAVFNFIREAAKKSQQKDATVYVHNGYSDWTSTMRPVRRNLDSVIMRGEEKAALFDDLANFMESEDFYLNHGLPYHRGYLLYGPPGTGKSSLAEAMATHLGLSIYALNLSSIENDAQFIETVNEIPDPKKAILLLEDVDTVGNAHQREQGGGEHKNMGVSLAALLNVFDGLQTPHGLIHVFTTNHPERLDPALTRAGRVDMKVHLDHMDQELFERMYRFYGGRGAAPTLRATNVPPSAVADAFKRSKNDLDQFEENVRKLAELTEEEVQKKSI